MLERLTRYWTKNIDLWMAKYDWVSWDCGNGRTIKTRLPWEFLADFAASREVDGVRPY